MLSISLIGLILCLVWIGLALFHGMFWRPLLMPLSISPSSWPSIDVIVPARDEAEAITTTLPALLAQDYLGEWKVILVDDHSIDGTGGIARTIAERLDRSAKLDVQEAPPLAAGWTGKLAAMNAGVAISRADLVLFTDADILHSPQSLSLLASRAEAEKLDLVSRMVLLNCASFAEKFLIPAFVFFFAMLYPFRRSNDLSSKTAAAAGGTILIRRALLEKFGGLSAIKSALIDDCSLAKAAKSVGGRIELALTKDIHSLRPYPHITDVWKMVARTAYTQLFYNPFLLAGTFAGLIFLYVFPVILFLYAPTLTAVLTGLFAWAVMTAIYSPMVRFYGLSWLWALTLPLAAILYGLATLESARLYYIGRGGQWKGRAQA